MGRLSQAHFDELFLNKVKQVCIHVLDQLNEANEIEQAFDLCPSISRRNRVILSFLHDADQLTATTASSVAGPSASSDARSASSSASSPLAATHPITSLLPSREASLGTDSIASLSAQRRRLAREMQYVRDPNDSDDDSDSRTTTRPSATSTSRLDPASARNPTMSQPDYTFEQFTEHLDPTDKLLKRSFEIIIKETARQALAKKRDPHHDSATASSQPSHDSAASLRSAIASSRSDRHTLSDRARVDIALARRMARALGPDAGPDSDVRVPNERATNLDHTYHLLRSIAPPIRSLSNRTSGNGQLSLPSNSTQRSSRHMLRDFLLPSTSWSPSTSSRVSQGQGRELASYSGNIQHRATPLAGPTLAFSSQMITARLAEASRRNAQAARTIDEAERLRSGQFIRTSIESLRASLFQFHIDLASTQLQNAHQGHLDQHQSPISQNSGSPDISSSYALVMDTIELFDDTLRRLSCLVSNSARDGSPGAQAQLQSSNADRNADSSQMRTSLWRARNLLLLSSMSRRNQNTEEASSTRSQSNARDTEIAAHRHFLATIEESHWSQPDMPPPSAQAIRAWRRKLAAWYHLDRDQILYPDAPHALTEQEGAYARWHPDVELAYPLDDEIHEPFAGEAATSRPDPIADPRAAWAFARQQDNLLSANLNEDTEVSAALNSSAVATAYAHLRSILTDQTNEAVRAVHAAGTIPVVLAQETSASDIPNTEVDPDVSLTRTTSLSRRNAVRGLPLTNSDASSIRSARSTLSLARARARGPEDRTGTAHGVQGDDPTMLDVDEADTMEEDTVETSIEIGTATRSPPDATTSEQPVLEGSIRSLVPPGDRPRSSRSGSFTFITTPAAVLRSRQRSQSRSHTGQRSQSPATIGQGDDEVLEGLESDAEEYIDLDLDLGMAGEDGFDFDLAEFLRTESRRAALQHDDDASPDIEEARSQLERRVGRLRASRAQGRDGGSGGSQDEDDDDDGAAAGIRVFVSGSGASTPAEARQATFEAYARRARLLERRRRMESQTTNQGDDTEQPDRRRRTARRDSNSEANPRHFLPFPRTSER